MRVHRLPCLSAHCRHRAPWLLVRFLCVIPDCLRVEFRSPRPCAQIAWRVGYYQIVSQGHVARYGTECDVLRMAWHRFRGQDPAIGESAKRRWRCRRVWSLESLGTESDRWLVSLAVFKTVVLPLTGGRSVRFAPSPPPRFSWCFSRSILVRQLFLLSRWECRLD